MEDKKLFLVVDDNDANVMVLSTMLRELGFEVDEASSGMEAIDLSCKKKYDVIFIDHLMPGMDGAEAAKQILFISEGKNSPIIIGVTATVDREVKEAFAAAGVQEVIQRPIPQEKLKNKLISLGISPAVSQEQQEKGDGDIDAILSGVRGLDYKKGLEMLAGSVDNYMKVLTICIKNIQENYNSIELIRDTKQVENFALYFHSLKGIFLNIGADKIAEQSKTLEFAAREGKNGEVQEQLADYLAALMTFQADLQTACDVYAEKYKKNTVGKNVSGSAFLTELAVLRQHIEDFEYIEITEKLEELLAGSSGAQQEALEEIASAIQDFDYDKALECVDRLQENS